MDFQVRPIHDGELEAWIETMHVAFHNSGSVAEEAAYQRDVQGIEYGRLLAAFDNDRLVGTYESFTAELTLPGGGGVAANAVSSVTVLPTHHRKGLLTRAITLDLRHARDRGELASILIAAEYPIYGRFGFGPAAERASYRLDPQVARFTRAAAGRLDLVEAAQLRELAPRLFDSFRRGWAGQIDRLPRSWDARLGVRPPPWRPKDQAIRCVLYTGPTEQPEGYLLYTATPAAHNHVPATKVDVRELISLTPDAYLALWRFCAELDLIAEVNAEGRSVEEPLGYLLHNARAALEQTARTDFLWLRPHDIERQLASRRYATHDQVILQVDDPLALSGGRFAVEGGPDGALCRRTEREADLSVAISSLGAISLGGVSVRLLAEAGLVEEHRPGAIDRADRLFRWPAAPWCSTFF